ncbi:hypothetical protein MRX96_024935 [Rhipicephalus microplus]
MVALNSQSYSFVEDHGFKELMAEAVPNYHLPSRTTLSRALVPRLFDDARKKVKDELSSAFEGVTSAVPFTSDIWASRANESYVSFTCHLPTPSFRMKQFTLNTRHMVVSHSAENIAQMLVEKCAEWEIPDSCRKYIVIDNGRNIRAAVRRLPWTEHACFAHTLQLAIHDAISNKPSIDRLCKKARHIVGHYRHSSSAQKRFDEYQNKMGKEPLCLVQDVDTRWSSQYLMLSRLLDLKEAVSVELAMSSSSVDGLCSAEWKEAFEYLDALKPLYDATVITSADKYPSLSTQIPIIFGDNIMRGCQDIGIAVLIGTVIGDNIMRGCQDVSLAVLIGTVIGDNIMRGCQDIGIAVLIGTVIAALSMCPLATSLEVMFRPRTEEIEDAAQ